MVFNNLESALNYIKKAVSATLNDDVASETGAMFMENAEHVVYDAYNPHYYERSYRLIDVGTYPVTQTGETEIQIEVNHPQGQLIEYGHGDGGMYQYPFNSDDTAWKFLRPRPFYRNTIEQLSGGKFRDLVKSGLNSRGVPTK